MANKIDAAIPVPDQYGQFWVFSGNHWVRIALKDGQPHGDEVVRGPGGFDEWPSLQGFDHVDAVIPVPNEHSQFWVFSGNQWVRISVTGGEPHTDTVVLGPGGFDQWPSLAKF
ncbi:hypothetical protein [Nonomuraea sp. NPDC005701]|uniref:hypothetical protein n=1 Tax=Nonomuraea sp. NPDC005701 TaxID=3157049 RepID=UPI0033DD7E8A